ncbi:hypothetical protein F5B21DRAFT_519265 [Xylaria acuta]|nr:hypothetical protein F5B21DRAFT_519265 [Xylaria acuta]
MIPGPSTREWALGVFRQSLRTSQLASPLQVTTASELPLDDPEELEYLRELIQYILDGRTIVASYNLVVLIILSLFTISHFYQSIIQSRKRVTIEGDLASDGGHAVSEAAEDGEHGADSSSSSTLDGSLSSRTTYLKDTDADIERQPLLGVRRDWPPPGRSKPSAFAMVRSWLMYQPRPIPFINRSLPSNATSLFVVGYYSLNVFAHLFKIPFELRHFFVFADRAGYVFIVNLPLLYLLAAKNQPLKRLTGRSYEALNIYHRRVGELMCFEALIHFVGMVIWRLYLEPEWLATGSRWHYFTHPLILLGIGAFVSYEFLYFTSLASFRERWYELFLASHVLLQIAALVFLWLHFFTSRPYVLVSLAIFVLDRIVWRIGLKSAVIAADIEVLEDGDTVNALQAHPFTIASAAPKRDDVSAQLNLLIRAYTGFTSELLRHAQLNSTVSVRIDGPYGSQDPLDALRTSKSAILIAGGSGVAVVFPLLWDLAIVHPGKRQIHFMWVIHSGSQRSWLPADRLDKLHQAGVHITVPQPTVEVGRPDVARYISEVARASLTDISAVVSGPDGLNRTVRNACAREVRSGADIDLRVEKFGW